MKRVLISHLPPGGNWTVRPGTVSKALMNTSVVFRVAAAWSLAFQTIGPPIPDIPFRLGTLGLRRAPIQTEAKLRQVIGSDAGDIVRDAIGRFPNIAKGTETRVVFVVAEQLPEEWLPRLEGLSFQRLPVNWDGWKAECARVMWIEARRDGDNLEVMVSEGNQCGHTNRTVEYSYDGQRWRDAPGVAGGAGGVSGPCGCR
jgi:hypothetical protein